MESTTSSSDSESSEESSSILTLVDFTVLPFEELGPAAAELPKKSSPAGRCSEPVEVSTSFFCFLLLVCYEIRNTMERSGQTRCTLRTPRSTSLTLPLKRSRSLLYFCLLKLAPPMESS